MRHPKRGIDSTGAPTWEAILGQYIPYLQNGTPSQQTEITRELFKMAKAADGYAELADAEAKRTALDRTLVEDIHLLCDGLDGMIKAFGESGNEDLRESALASARWALKKAKGS